jgi:Glyoxalase-like domain
MSLRVETVTVDAHDPEALARWWAELLGSTAAPDDDDWVVDAGGVTLLFGADPEEKVVKNRVHLDLRPDDRDAEVARAEALGATRVDIGQGDQTWVVLADPEGNEFCILRSRPA